MAATIHALGPGSRGQDADDLSACFGATTVAGSRFDDPGEIPAGAPAHLGDLQGTPRFAAVERYCGDPDTDLVARSGSRKPTSRIASLPHSRINDHGTDLLRHMFSPPWRWLKVSGLQWPGPGHRGAGAK